MSGGRTQRAERNGGPAERPEGACGRAWWWRRLSNQNPFYLLSTCCLLHAAAYLFDGETTATNPWPLMGLVCGFVALMALTGYLVVRLGRVWDDARSILLIVLLLFVELALAFDETLLVRPVSGALVTVLGLAFAVGVTEFLLRGLRIRLPPLYRLPLHLLLGVIFLYPLVLAGVLRSGRAVEVVWWIYGFSLAGAGALLTLLPAVRRGADYVAGNGTPWSWPWFPWPAFVVLAVGLGFRSYALSQSFDPVLSLGRADAMAYASAYGVYFLVPLVFAVAVLVLEAGLVCGSRAAVRAGLALPFAGVLMSVTGEGGPGPYGLFLSQFTEAVGCPLYATAVGLVAFYGFAAARQTPRAGAWLAFTLVLLAYVDRTGGFGAAESPHPLPLLVAAGLQLVPGIRRRESRRVLTGLLCLGLIEVPAWGAAGEVYHVQRLLAAVLVTGVCLRDRLAYVLRRVAAFGLLVSGAALVARPGPAEPLMWLQEAAVLGCAVFLAVRFPSPSAIGYCVACGVVVGAGWWSEAYAVLVRHPAWVGIRSLLVAGLLFVAAALTSAYKGGLWGWWRARWRGFWWIGRADRGWE